MQGMQTFNDCNFDILSPWLGFYQFLLKSKSPQCRKVISITYNKQIISQNTRFIKMAPKIYVLFLYNFIFYVTFSRYTGNTQLKPQIPPDLRI